MVDEPVIKIDSPYIRTVLQARDREVKLIAARESVFVWKDKLTIRYPDDVPMGIEACPLCKLYYGQTDICAGCPIQEFTGSAVCEGTPYEEAADALTDWDYCCNGNSSSEEIDEAKQKWLDAAKEEIAFLEKVVTFLENQS
jgi:hypothetical protein